MHDLLYLSCLNIATLCEAQVIWYYLSDLLSAGAYALPIAPWDWEGVSQVETTR